MYGNVPASRSSRRVATARISAAIVNENPELRGKKVLLLDMNSTFMFGEDRFGNSEDFSTYYFKIGGTLPQSEINGIVRAVYKYLDTRYPDENYWDNFPSLESAIREVTVNTLNEVEINKIIDILMVYF